MGLQFIDANGTERTLTEADMLLPDFQETYSDLFKSLHGFRPRGMMDPASMLRFFDTYEAEFEAQAEQEKAALAYASERDGFAYTSWSHFYELKEERDRKEWEAEEAARRAAAAEKAEFNRRGSPAPVIEAWEHGAL